MAGSIPAGAFWRAFGRLLARWPVRRIALFAEAPGTGRPSRSIEKAIQGILFDWRYLYRSAVPAVNNRNSTQENARNNQRETGEAANRPGITAACKPAEKNRFYTPGGADHVKQQFISL